ncbi:uncharacterized protein [Argopecten irradians]|uniref:uncharacterized protein n=1 Tax=Argopecten irradians TaxID=31199 RepID=UPI00371EF0D4
MPQHIFEARLKKFSPFNNVSLECCKCDQPAAIRCTQCREILCQRCDNEQHIYNGLHDREFIVGQHWAYGQPLQGISNDNGPPRIVEVERYLPVFPKVCPCGTADSIEQFTITRRFKVIAVTELGRYDILLPFVNCPHCNRD